ncbi:hypothetical protein PMAYCL1PPCAC_29863 [Pristionchus mayeri]|uniref:Uncharacterized protein n=1 Tax=Pristionchus mayeri TaxID=1317129 RepID=A0AAN5IB81_9BILA|nr:hypothetical protein PMAYCL1PPCAC_29863 [Pristionchus mayeri]
MRRRMKNAAIASSRQIRRASSSLTEKFSNFVSRPIKERSLNNFMERVQQRKERRLKQNSESMQLRESEDAFPTMAGALSADKLVETPGSPSERSERSTKSEKSEMEKKKIGSKEADKIFPDLGKEKKNKKGKSGSKTSKRPFVNGRRRGERNNEIFVNGRPFWMRAGRITQEEKNEITRDDLPLNAEVIVDVKNGKIELPVLPSIQFQFDEYAPMETLRGRDKVFFTHKMLFANTIRSMINTAEPESKTDTDTTKTEKVGIAEKTGEMKTEGDEEKGRVQLLPHPKYCTSYSRALPSGKMHREPYEWTGKGVV